MNIDLKLTPSELAYTNKILAKRGRFIYWWPWCRWLCLCMGIIFLALAAFIAYQSYQISLYDCGGVIDEGDLRSADSSEISMMRLRFHVLFVMVVLINTVVGLNVLIATILFWGRHKKDAVFTKVARAVIATATESNGTAVE